MRTCRIYFPVTTSIYNWSTVLKSPEGDNSPRLDLLLNSPFPPSVTLLRKWSLKFTALFR